VPRTRAVRRGVRDDSLGGGTGASLVGAVADSEAEVGGVAVADVVSRGASKHADGLVDHAVNAGVLQESVSCW